MSMSISSITGKTPLVNLIKETEKKQTNCETTLKDLDRKNRLLSSVVLIFNGTWLGTIAVMQGLKAIGGFSITQNMIQIAVSIGGLVIPFFALLWIIYAYKQNSLNSESAKYTKIINEAEQQIKSIDKATWSIFSKHTAA